MYHGDGGNLKDKVRGMTNHSKRLPEAQRSQLVGQRKRPVMMSVAQQEAAVLGEEKDPEDPLEKDPEDPEAVQWLRKGDEALHDGDMDEAVKLCAPILPIRLVHRTGFSTVQGCGRREPPVDTLPLA